MAAIQSQPRLLFTGVLECLDAGEGAIECVERASVVVEHPRFWTFAIVRSTTPRTLPPSPGPKTATSTSALTSPAVCGSVDEASNR